MSKAEIICKLHEITDHYLLGPGNWPANRESLVAFFKTVRDLGLNEDVPGLAGTTRSTLLGKELQLDMLMAFVGAWDIWEIPHVLESNGYMEESEADEIFSSPLMQTERKLYRYVLRAYFKFCKRSQHLH